MGGSNDQKGKILCIIGILLVILALAADAIGIGGNPGFGLAQGVLLILGAGLVIMSKKCCCTGSGGGDAPSDAGDAPSEPPAGDQT